MRRGLTDIHHHILSGMDDGAQNSKEMHAMLRRAADDGIVRIVATPHVTPGVERFDREQYDRALQEAREYCEEKRIPMEIYGGAEILYTNQTCRFLEDGRVPTMADTEFVLVEFSPDIRYERLCAALTDLLHTGFLPIVAHVERYHCLNRHPSRLLEIKRELDVCYQVNCATIIKQRDLLTRRFLKKILDWDLLDVIATDSHHAAVSRTVNMREAWLKLKQEYGGSYANELTDGHLLFGNIKNQKRG